jgi:hypothetical protein
MKQLVVYATGASVHFSDRAAVERILQKAKASDYGVRTIIREIAQSGLFGTK